jgi:hypothetical protein
MIKADCFELPKETKINPFSIPFKPKRKEDYEIKIEFEETGINPFSIPFQPKRKEDYEDFIL